jgi:hypothetical protein
MVLFTVVFLIKELMSYKRMFGNGLMFVEITGLNSVSHHPEAPDLKELWNGLLKTQTAPAKW